MSPRVTLFISELMAKRLELFSGAMPSTPAIVTLANPKNPTAESEAKAQKSSPQANLLRVTPIAEIQRDTAAVLQKSLKGAEPAPASCTLNHRTTEPQYRRDGHLLGRWSLVFTFKVNQRCGGMCRPELPSSIILEVRW
jgi:hypothetical protein